MNGNLKLKKESIPTVILEECKKMSRREKYLYERDKGRLIRFDERYVTDESKSNLVEDLIIARNVHIALERALTELSEEESAIIDEGFFQEPKESYTALAKNRGISRQAYSWRLDRILKKLKRLFVLYYDEF